MMMMGSRREIRLEFQSSSSSLALFSANEFGLQLFLQGVVDRPA
jgi:hypothetical protein